MEYDSKTIEEGIYQDIQTFVETLFSEGSITSEVTPDQEVVIQKGSNLAHILSRLNAMISGNGSKGQGTKPDVYNLVSVLSLSLRGYLALLPQSRISSLASRVNVETVNWLAQLFKYENVNGYFHYNRLDGLLRVSKLALYLKYAKYASDGFTALYTRPPVIYISAAAPPNLGKDLKTHLGLPQSSICTVPCNSMFGSPYTMDVAAFERLLTDDISCGKTPLLLIAYAGTPLAGHTDNLSRLREVCTQSGVWLHVEGDNLTSLALQQVPSSVSSASNADSATLDIGMWFGMRSLPFCTLFRTSNTDIALSVGLTSADPLEKLHCLPLWIAFQFMGKEDLHKIVSHASEISQQLSDRIDAVTGLKRIEQINTTSPVVLFKYKASPELRSDSLSSQDDEDNGQDNVEAKNQGSGFQPVTALSIAPHMTDELNRLILKEINVMEVFEGITLVREGLCIKFNPYLVLGSGPVTKDDIDKVISRLEAIVTHLDYSLILRSKFGDLISKVPNVVVIESGASAIIGAFQCVPKYWKTTNVSNLSDSKKREANSLNTEVLEKLSIKYENLTMLKNATGQNYISVGFSKTSLDLNQFCHDLTACLDELEDNSMFLQSVSEAVQKSIIEAEERLHKESEEKLFEGGILRLVPVVGSFYNWLSPPPKDDRGVTGKSFHIGKGKLESTEKTYKLKMQVTDEDEGDNSAQIKEHEIAHGSTQLPSKAKGIVNFERSEQPKAGVEEEEFQNVSDSPDEKINEISGKVSTVGENDKVTLTSDSHGDDDEHSNSSSVDQSEDRSFEAGETTPKEVEEASSMPDENESQGSDKESDV